MVDQTAMFQEGEGDAWFRRNLDALSSPRADDPALSLAKEVIGGPGARIGSVCEFGCANGWRLAALSDSLAPDARIAGFDVSAEAIRDGQHKWPHLDLRVGVADEPPFDGRFDLVIVNFVLHWIDRDRLARTIVAIDESIGDGGFLILSDFLPSTPCKTRYHHLPDSEVYTYKQDYRTIFEALGSYREIQSRIFGHGREGAGDAGVTDADRAVCALLQKSLAAYELVALGGDPSPRS